MAISALRVSASCTMALLIAGCTQQVTGLAVFPQSETPGLVTALGVDVDDLMLDLPRMRTITGAGQYLNVIPTMDGKYPVDIELLAKDVPPPCQFVFEETQTFGPDLADFHKTTYQNPPGGGLISQGAAVYRDAPTARAAFDNLVTNANACAQGPAGPVLVGYVASGADSMQLRPARTCGRDYQLKSVVLAEVTFCEFPETVPAIVMTNLLDRVPG
ncbi:MAG: sensor domain-containing protein [Mycobacterium sp.]